MAIFFFPMVVGAFSGHRPTHNCGSLGQHIFDQLILCVHASRTSFLPNLIRDYEDFCTHAPFFCLTENFPKPLMRRSSPLARDDDQQLLINKSKNLAEINSSATPISWSPGFGESRRTTRLVPLMKMAPGKSKCSSVGVMVKSRIWPCSREGSALTQPPVFLYAFPFPASFFRRTKRPAGASIPRWIYFPRISTTITVILSPMRFFRLPSRSKLTWWHSCGGAAPRLRVNIQSTWLQDANTGLFLWPYANTPGTRLAPEVWPHTLPP